MAAPDVFSKKLLTANIKWKGRTFQQLSSGIKYNQPTYSTSKPIAPILLRRALPLQLYRRELASKTTQCNPRTSMIRQFDNPGQTIVTQYATIQNGLATTLDFNYENNRCQHPPNPISSDTTCSAFLSQQDNARRRVRSAGMIRRKFDPVSNAENYYTNTNQYLTARTRNYQQTQYFHIKYGDSAAKPGTNASYNNIYTANGISHCPKFALATPVTLSYYWLNNAGPNDNTTALYSITIPAGLYDINDFNAVVQTAMYNNTHYLISLATNTVVYFLNFSYNVANNRVELDSLVLPDDSTIGIAYQYSPATSSWGLINTATGYFNPNVVLSGAPLFTQGLGFAAGTYPASNTNSTNQVVLGTSVPKLQSNFVPIYYKPNNPQFGRQGAVTSGDLITRRRYNTITKAANSFRSAYGNQTADAVAYGVPPYGYTLKDRIGFPNIRIPTVGKYTGGLRKCVVSRRMRNMRSG